MTITNQSLPLLHPHAAFYTSLPPSHALPPAGALDLPPECHQHQAHAPHLHPWGGGHDPVGRPERGRHPAQPAHQIPGEAHICGYQAVALCLRTRAFTTMTVTRNMVMSVIVLVRINCELFVNKGILLGPATTFLMNENILFCPGYCIFTLSI